MIATLNSTCDEMRKHITIARQESAPMLEEASVLISQKGEVETKQHLLTAFNKHFILSDEELSCLTSSAEPIDDHFFDVLTRAKKIHDDCEVLLENENQRLGLELMEQTSRHINTAYKKLYTWVQKEFKTLDLEDPRISGSVRRALRGLAERPTLFQSCLDFFAEAREHNLSAAFHAALTETHAASGTANVVPNAKPIEFSTHDTLRYVGDMLAWVHSAAVSEREALEGLFVSDAEELAKGINSGRQSEPWMRTNQTEEDEETVVEDAPFDGRAALSSLIGRNLSGVTQTLRQRVEYAVRSNDDPVVVYKNMGLISFYLDIFVKLVGEDSTLSEHIKGLQKSTFTHFEQLMIDEAGHASNEAALPDDLSAPPFLLNALDRLTVLLKAHSSSFRTTTTPSDTDTQSSITSITRLLSVALTPFLDQCSELSSSFPPPESINPPDPSSPIFQLNYILPVRSTVLPYLPSTSSLPTTLTTKITNLTTNLTQIQHVYFLHSSFLNTLLTTLPTSPAIDITDLPVPFQPTNLTASAAELDAFLPSALMDAMENLRFLNDKGIARRCTEEAVDLFVEDFEKVVLWLEEWDREHGIEDTGSVEMSEVESVVAQSVRTARTGGEVGKVGLRRRYPRRVEEVRVLLS